jgi:hypothetical protein
MKALMVKKQNVGIKKMPSTIVRGEYSGLIKKHGIRFKYE